MSKTNIWNKNMQFCFCRIDRWKRKGEKERKNKRQKQREMENKNYCKSQKILLSKYLQYSMGRGLITKILVPKHYGYYYQKYLTMTMSKILTSNNYPVVIFTLHCGFNITLCNKAKNGATRVFVPRRVRAWCHRVRFARSGR